MASLRFGTSFAAALAPLARFAARSSASAPLAATRVLLGAGDDPVFRREGQVMGTIVTFSAYTADQAGAERAFGLAFDELQRLDRLLTDWERPGQPPSDVVRINREAGRAAVKVAPETMEVIDAAQAMSRRSDGAFDITFAALHGLWKFDEDLATKVPSPAAIASRRRLIDYRQVIVDHERATVRLAKPGMRLGLGGIAKGYAVDRAVAVLKRAGLQNFMVQAGGDLYVAGRKGDGPWHVGIKDPRGQSAERPYFAVAPINDHAFSTAGDYERAFISGGRRYHHIIDPRTGYPATASRSVTIFADTALAADALDDAVFILGPERGLALVEATPGAGAVIVDARNHVWVSKRLQGVVRVERPPTDGR
jgi:thiamine biosynthesis lipoprotein